MQVLADDAPLFSGTQDFGLLNHCLRVPIETVPMTTWAGSRPFCDDRVTALADLVSMGFFSNFRCFRGPLAKRHELSLRRRTPDFKDSKRWAQVAKEREPYL